MESYIVTLEAVRKTAVRFTPGWYEEFIVGDVEEWARTRGYTDSAPAWALKFKRHLCSGERGPNCPDNRELIRKTIEALEPVLAPNCGFAKFSWDDDDHTVDYFRRSHLVGNDNLEPIPEFLYEYAPIEGKIFLEVVVLVDQPVVESAKPAEEYSEEEM